MLCLRLRSNAPSAVQLKPNTWEHVFFQALANDTWFISGDFDAIE